MSHLTSTLIDDESLIEELRRYGEKNLPSLPVPGSRKKANQLNDQNREIYLKKLNHYKAREKAESNPSKQYIKQQMQTSQADTSSTATSGKRTSARIRSPLKKEYDRHNSDEDEDNDIIEIDSTQNTSEYVQVSNAYTSPLSTTRYYENARSSMGNSNRASLNGFGEETSAPYANTRYGSSRSPLPSSMELSNDQKLEMSMFYS